MAKQPWKVKLHEARTQADYLKSNIAADFIEVFGVVGDGPDEAKREGTRWLVSRGYTLRSINVSAATERTLIAYVAAGSVKAAKEANKTAARGP